jgi:hypothetical protein
MMLLLLGRIALAARIVESTTEVVIDDRACKHWAIAGVMKRFVSMWDLQVSKWSNAGHCFISSLRTVTCCGIDLYVHSPSLRSYALHPCIANNESDCVADNGNSEETD